MASGAAGATVVSWTEGVGLSVLGIGEVGGGKVLVAGADTAVGMAPDPHPTVSVTSPAASAVGHRLLAGISVA